MTSPSMYATIFWLRPTPTVGRRARPSRTGAPRVRTSNGRVRHSAAWRPSAVPTGHACRPASTAR
eukprot:14865186-Alexandrium_andersonii.AAC.1